MLAVFIQWSERPGQGGCCAQRTVVVTRFQRFVKAGVAPMVCSQEPDTFCFCLRTRFSPDSIGYSIERFLREIPSSAVYFATSRCRKGCGAVLAEHHSTPTNSVVADRDGAPLTAYG